MSEFNYLSDLSPKDKPWDTHRSFADQVRDLYHQTEFSRYYERISRCSQILEFALAATEHDELLFRLQSAHFCRCRHCPICQWRRSLMWKARFFQVLPKIQSDYPESRFIFLTLTVSNCPISELRQTLVKMNKAWELLTKRKTFPAQGWVKSVEVTKSKHGENMAHPHLHVLLMVPPGYFKGKNYISQKKWRQLWKSALRIDYDPVVHVRAVKPKNGVSGDGITDALRETLKYTVKAEDLVASPDWLEQLTTQLHNMRAIALGGTFRKYLSEEEPVDLIRADEAAESEPVSEERFYFGWRENLERYTYKKPADCNPE